MSATPAARERRRVRIPLFLTAAAAWALLAVVPLPMAMVGHHATMPADPMPAGPTMSAEPMMSADMAPGPSSPTLLAALVSLAPAAALMVVGMMWPLLGPAIGHVRAQNLARRRAHAVALFVVPYTLVWIVACTVLAAVPHLAAATGLDRGVLVIAVLLTAVVWQLSPAKQRCLNRTHRHPELSAFGAAAVADPLRFGTTHAMWCVGSCWALMLVPFAVPAAHLLVMLVVTLSLADERLARPTLPRWGARRPTEQRRAALARGRGVLGRPPISSPAPAPAPRSVAR